MGAGPLEGSAPDASPDDELTAERRSGRSGPGGGGRCCRSCGRTAPGRRRHVRAWFDTSDPFGRATAGVELLTFHGAKGREWHTVHLAGCETSLVPHRTATTIAARAEEARLLYVACTRATDALTINWAQRRSGYQRKFTPLLDGFEHHAGADAAPRRHRGAASPVIRDGAPRPAPHVAGLHHAAGVLPEALVTDAVLASIADRPPASADELAAITSFVHTPPNDSRRRSSTSCARPKGGVRHRGSGRSVGQVDDDRRVVGRRGALAGVAVDDDHAARSATDAEQSRRSMRRPRPWWKSPAR